MVSAGHRALTGLGGPQYGHVDTTRNRAAPEVELALIALDFSGLKAAMQCDGNRCARRLPVRAFAAGIRNPLKNSLLNQVIFPIRAVICL
ncbi:hypothetical protein DF141_29710 [Burkholderia cenocepacia]|nr:hypothetical protein DF147_19090 [Burkholderia cenocepacia]RQU67494.1 hypothetical protein DF141_29710 [Burkholderia cenocepacia]RQV87772.1 hypothetical protein DF019_21260 [Burkholderia cenocepacia]RQZ87631.1 hypothetical protein DF058_29380 [Burkholderia cenocepacia]RRA06992.1 hypothetical protein DF059_29595 [Burkholderia cenocepacia]